MATEKKMTVREGFEACKAIVAEAGREDLVEFLEKRIELAAKKSSGERKPTAKQVENEALREKIAEFMEAGKGYTAGEIAKTCPAIAESHRSVNSVSALMTGLFKAGKVTKEEIKGKMYYTLAE